MTKPPPANIKYLFKSIPFHAMGGPCELKLYAPNARILQQAADAAMAEVLRIEQSYSRYRDDSIITAINTAAGNAKIEVDEETAALLDYANAAFEQSDGLFDITSGVLRGAWDFKSGQLPSAGIVASLQQRVGWQKVQWSRPYIHLPEQGMELDFGGFGKEYAADAAARVCKEQGIAHGLVELGGDIHVIGPHPDGSPWKIGLRNPRKPDEAIHVISVSQGGLASSGDYERFMIIDGTRYCHILNPKTGWPISDHFASVSVLAPLCLIAGTGATVAMLQGHHGGREWLESLGLPYFWVGAAGEIAGSLQLA
ncbi:MAG: thiamine biosynthesis lipoprotein [Paracoccaceae bacterium]|jgi:thiamine biosynthesis lipoprotein